MKQTKREIELLVLSDIHLGTYGCHATELLTYLKSIHPKELVLNGDIIDIWQFNKRYWPASHMLVVKHLVGLMAGGTRVHYITGNHDEMLRKFSGCSIGSLQIMNKLLLTKGDAKIWFFHGDVFDVSMKHAKWLAKLGSVGYDMLILLNRVVNFVATRLGKEKLSLSKKIKDKVKRAVSFISAFEQTAAEIGISNAYQYVVCGHIHQPEIREVSNEDGSIIYMNSGDWVENLSALEFNHGQWTIFKYHEHKFETEILPRSETEKLNKKQLFESLLSEISMLQTAG